MSDQVRPGIEGLTVAQWITVRLTSDPDLQAMAGSAASLKARVKEGTYTGAAVPWWVVFDVMEGRDVKVLDLVQVMGQVPFQVKVVAAASGYSDLIAPYERVHALLEGQVDQVTKNLGTVLTSERVSSFQYPETSQGVEYRHLGGRYLTNVQ